MAARVSPLQLLGVALGPVLTFLAFMWTQRRAKKINDLAASNESRRIDGEAYDRAREINKDLVVDLRAEVERLRAELATERQEREHDRTEHERAIRTLTATVGRLSAEVASYRRQLGIADEGEGSRVGG